MPTKNDSGVTAEIRHDEDGQFVHYGFVENGVFHPVASERKGDYTERVNAAQEEGE